MLMHYFSCSGGPGADPTKTAVRLATLNLCFFAFRWIYESRSASVVRNVDALFSCSGGAGADPTKYASEHVRPNLCLCIQ
jgi:hypothetical protein